MDREGNREQTHLVDKGWYYLDKTIPGGESKDCFAAIDKSTDYVMGFFSESVKVEKGAKIRDSLLYGEVFVSKSWSALLGYSLKLYALFIFMSTNIRIII